MGLHHLLLSRTTSNFSLVLLQAVEDFVVLWFVLCHHPSKLVSSLVNANSAGHHRIVKDASSNHRLAVRLFVLVLGGHQLHQVGDLLTDHLRRLLDHLAVQAVELCEVVVCQFFFLVSLTSGKSVRGILNSMLKYSNTFSSPRSNSFFFPSFPKVGICFFR